MNKIELEEIAGGALQEKAQHALKEVFENMLAGTVEAGSIAEYGDDGVTQKASVKTGIASKGEAIVPNPVNLRPYRTFPEVEQPESSFIFRMKQDKHDGIACAVFEADGGAWKNEAMKRIKEYICSELKKYTGKITVIS